MPTLRRALRSVFLGLAAVIVFIEEFGWRPLSRWLGRLARWAPIARLEALIRGVGPRVALVLFGVPAVVLFPVKIGALALVHAGHPMLGLGVIVAAKVLGTALVGRLFVLLEPQLRQFPWFVRALDWWASLKQQARAWWRATTMARRIAALKRGWRGWRRRALR